MPIVLGIDPGPEFSCIVAYDGQRILYATLLPNREMLAHLLVEKYNADHLAIEMIASYGMPVSDSVFDTCVWIGRFQQQFGADRVKLIKRLEVKLHLTHESRAKDSNIRAALIDRFGEPGSKTNPAPARKATSRRR